MNDNIFPWPLIGTQIRQRRVAKGLSLAELAKRVGTSAPTVHRYESGWDRFELVTLRKIATALDARLEVWLMPRPSIPEADQELSSEELVGLLAPLFWDKDLNTADLDEHPQWVLTRVLMFGNPRQVDAARPHFGDEAVRRAASRRGVDAKTRNYWNLVLGGCTDASQGPQ